MTAGPETASTIKDGDPASSSPTVRANAADTRPLQPAATVELNTVVPETSTQVRAPAVPWAWFVLIAIVVVVAVASVVATWPRDRRGSDAEVLGLPVNPVAAQDPLHNTTPTSPNTPIPNPVTVAPGTPDAGIVDAGGVQDAGGAVAAPADPRPPVRRPTPPVERRPDDPNRARLLFLTGRRLEVSGRAEDAELAYLLAYTQSGRRPNPNIFLNLGLLHDKAENIPKAKACFSGYLARTSAGAAADQVKTKLASYPPVRTVPCVSKREAARAKKQYARRGAVIDTWIEETVKGMLK